MSPSTFAAKAERDPAEQYTASGRLLSGIKPSIRDSSLSAADVDGAGDMPFLPLVRLANVDEERALGGLETRLGLDGRDLVDLLPGLCDQLSVRRHYFGNYSVEGMGQTRGA